MSQFEALFSENKLRIPLSAYAAQIIENDCLNFSRKKTTLINAIILNYYQEAPCSISLRVLDYKKELISCFKKTELQRNEAIIDKILLEKSKELKEKYAKRKKADVNWQITLNKRVIELLTSDPYSHEEQYYDNKPGRFVQSLIEEYAIQPFYIREEIVYKQIIDTIKEAIPGKNLLKITNNNNKRILLKPYKIASDPLSMYHYIVGYSSLPESISPSESKKYSEGVLSIRLSRIIDAEIPFFPSKELSPKEIKQIETELVEKGVQFVSGDTSPITIWLSDYGIKKYNSQLHLRPLGYKDDKDEHIYHFECTEAQVLYYFIGFGKDVKVLSPGSLVSNFKNTYDSALELYK